MSITVAIIIAVLCGVTAVMAPLPKVIKIGLTIVACILIVFVIIRLVGGLDHSTTVLPTVVPVR